MSERRRYEINPSFADLFTTQEDFARTGST